MEPDIVDKIAGAVATVAEVTATASGLAADLAATAAAAVITTARVAAAAAAASAAAAAAVETTAGKGQGHSYL